MADLLRSATIKIFDLHNLQSEPWIYVGRYAPYTKHGTLLRSPLANPFKPKGNMPVSLTACLVEYRAWLWARIKERDTNVMQALSAITEDSNLACWCLEAEGDGCFPDFETCHAVVIAKAWRHLQRGVL